MRTALLTLVLATTLFAQQPSAPQSRSSGPAKGTLIVDGGGASVSVKERFLALAGGKSARIVVIPTGASAMKFSAENTILNPDWPRERSEWSAYERWLKQWLGVEQVTLLHTRDRAVADSESFVAPLQNATGVFIGAGNAGRLASAYLGTRTQKELQALIDRGGVIFGSSAGAIILGFIHRPGMDGEAHLDGAWS
jgi:cyanophycinase